jgi:hypothetical protein
MAAVDAAIVDIVLKTRSAIGVRQVLGRRCCNSSNRHFGERIVQQPPYAALGTVCILVATTTESEETSEAASALVLLMGLMCSSCQDCWRVIIVLVVLVLHAGTAAHFALQFAPFVWRHLAERFFCRALVLVRGKTRRRCPVVLKYLIGIKVARVSLSPVREVACSLTLCVDVVVVIGAEETTQELINHCFTAPFWRSGAAAMDRSRKGTRLVAHTLCQPERFTRRPGVFAVYACNLSG